MKKFTKAVIGGMTILTIGVAAIPWLTGPQAENVSSEANSSTHNFFSSTLLGYAALWSKVSDSEARKQEQEAQAAKKKTDAAVKEDKEKNALPVPSKPEVLDSAIELVASSDPEKRRSGIEIIQRHSVEWPDVRKVVKQVLATEHSADLLIQALAAFNATDVDANEAHEIVGILGRLAQHPDPAVRSQSILRLAQWDGTGEGAERLIWALADSNSEVKQAAVSAIADAKVHGENTKSALWKIINNYNEPKQLRVSAVHALERFHLSPPEKEAYLKARSQVMSL